MSLNYRRGLHRAWAVGAILWVAAVAYDMADTMMFMQRFRAERGMPQEDPLTAFGIGDFLLWGLAPPLAVLIGGHLLAWILHGFRPQGNG